MATQVLRQPLRINNVEVPATLQITPGMLCTVYVGSDRYTGQVMTISSGGKVVGIRYGGGEEVNVREQEDRSWRITGKVGWRVIFGAGDDYRDPSF